MPTPIDALYMEGGGACLAAAQPVETSASCCPCHDVGRGLSLRWNCSAHRDREYVEATALIVCPS